MVEILTQFSPHKLLKSLGALYKDATGSQKSMISLLSVLDTMEWSKTISRFCPFKSYLIKASAAKIAC
jgi:hypothetical protein